MSRKFEIITHCIISNRAPGPLFSKGGKIVRARDYWIFLVAQHEMSRLEMDELGLLGI